MANAAVVDDAQQVEDERAPKHMHLSSCPPLMFDQAREREHNRYAGYKNEKRKDEIVETESFPVHMGHLCAKKGPH